jgi:hypothetical protein
MRTVVAERTVYRRVPLGGVVAEPRSRGLAGPRGRFAAERA